MNNLGNVRKVLLNLWMTAIRAIFRDHVKFGVIYYAISSFSKNVLFIKPMLGSNIFFTETRKSFSDLALNVAPYYETILFFI